MALLPSWLPSWLLERPRQQLLSSQLPPWPLEPQRPSSPPSRSLSLRLMSQPRPPVALLRVATRCHLAPPCHTHAPAQGTDSHQAQALRHPEVSWRPPAWLRAQHVPDKPPPCLQISHPRDQRWTQPVAQYGPSSSRLARPSPAPGSRHANDPTSWT